MGARRLVLTLLVPQATGLQELRQQASRKAKQGGIQEKELKTA